MTLSKETLEQLAKVDKINYQLAKAINDLAGMIEADTNELLSVCTVVSLNLQLYDNSANIGRSSEEALEAIKDIADDGNSSIKWEDAENTCYAFSIDRHPMRILIGKEKQSE